MTEKLLFLTSNRFWVMVGVVVLALLKNQGWLESTIADPLILFGMTFIGVRTADRAFENLK